MPSLTALFSTLLAGCNSEPQPVSYDLECSISDSCFGGYSELQLTDAEFVSYLDENNQLTEQQCIYICMDTYYYDDLCGCHYLEKTENEEHVIRCETVTCEIEGRGHGNIQKATHVFGPTALSHWFARALHAEASSVASFLQLRAELLQVHAPQPLLDRCLRAAKQEVVHARLMAKYCKEQKGTPPPLDFGSPPQRSLFLLAMDNAIEGCVFETYAALRAHHQSMHAEEEHIRNVMKTIACDETEHAQLAWDIHSWILPQLTVQECQEIHIAMRKAFENLVESVQQHRQHPMASRLGFPDVHLVHALQQEIAA